jgi:hypothetical protein
VQRVGKDATHYFIHRDFYKTLARIRARTLMMGYGSRQFGAASTRQQLQAETPPTLALGHAGAQTNSEHENDDRRQAELESERHEIRRHLLMAMGLAPSMYDDLVRSKALPAANVVGQQLSGLAKRAPLLGSEVETDMADLRSALEHAVSALKLERANPSQLEAAHRDVEHALPVLMLLPNGRYQERLAHIIEGMEDQDGKGALYPNDRAFLAQLRQHYTALKRLSRSSSEDWQRVGHLLANLDENAISTAYDDGDRNRRPN